MSESGFDSRTFLGGLVFAMFLGVVRTAIPATEIVTDSERRGARLTVLEYYFLEKDGRPSVAEIVCW